MRTGTSVRVPPAELLLHRADAPRDDMTTIREVSRRAKVSVSTVSRVVNGTTPVAEDTRRRVLEAIEELDYRPNTFARGLVTNRSNGVGITVNEISSPYYGAVLQGVDDAVEAAGMHMLVSTGHARADSEREAIQFLLDRRADVVIVQIEALTNEELFAIVEATDTPIIVFGRRVPELDQRCVWLDNERGGALAVEHLLCHGHRRIAHIAGPLSYPDSRDRLHGYRHALEAAGIAYDERLVIESTFQEEGGAIAARRLLDRDPISPRSSRPTTRWPRAHCGPFTTQACVFQKTSPSSGTTTCCSPDTSFPS